ncbi:hypothetical protein [Paraburkholderia phosphatilytica]|uniref:hypothetical protein n=1 Tax=Paraburkholderia phosphatilytica TaxID=2282883 RepID=UPI000E49D141|nr:hypothetical protein [Paraburkholderia phosphatilytica]
MDDLRQRLHEVERAVAALSEVISVRREYVLLLQRLGSCDRELVGLEALTKALMRLQAQRDGLAVIIACGG